MSVLFPGCLWGCLWHLPRGMCQPWWQEGMCFLSNLLSANKTDELLSIYQCLLTQLALKHSCWIYARFAASPWTSQQDQALQAGLGLSGDGDRPCSTWLWAKQHWGKITVHFLFGVLERLQSEGLGGRGFLRRRTWWKSAFSAIMGLLLTCRKTLSCLFYVVGDLPSLWEPTSAPPRALCAAVGGTGRSWSWHWCRQDMAIVTQGGMVSPCSSAPLQRPGDWGQLERFSPSLWGGNHSTASPAGSSGTGQGRKGQVICGSRNPASPGDSAAWTPVIFWERSLSIPSPTLCALWTIKVSFCLLCAFNEQLVIQH